MNTLKGRGRRAYKLRNVSEGRSAVNKRRAAAESQKNPVCHSFGRGIAKNPRKMA